MSEAGIIANTPLLGEAALQEAGGEDKETDRLIKYHK